MEYKFYIKMFLFNGGMFKKNLNVIDNLEFINLIFMFCIKCRNFF